MSSMTVDTMKSSAAKRTTTVGCESTVHTANLKNLVIFCLEMVRGYIGKDSVYLYLAGLEDGKVGENRALLRSFLHCTAQIGVVEH